MVDNVNFDVLEDGKRNLVMKLTNISDGTGEAGVIKVSPPLMSGAPANVVIRRIKASTFGMGVQILWDATTDVLAWYIPADMDVDQDFTFFGGIQNNAGAGVTGDILFTTTGATAGDVYSIVLEMIKKY